VTEKKDSIEAVYYFTTLATWDPGKVARHRLFIRVQEAEGVNVVYGEFKRKVDTAPYAGTIFERSKKNKLM